MEDAEKLKLYLAMVDVSRKWVSVMDAKAGFLSALNAGLLAFIWSGAKFVGAGDWSGAFDLPKGLAITASAISMASLFSAIWIVLPRGSLADIFGNTSRYANGFKAISFYGYVASNYPKGQEHQFFKDVGEMDAIMLGREALEQHFTISHGLQKKSNWVKNSGWLLLVALVVTGAALFAKVIS